MLKLCVDLAREIADARDHAHKLKSVAKTLLTIASEPTDYDEVMEWRREARRMMRIAGDTDPWLGDATELVIQAAKNAKVSIPQAMGSKALPVFEGPRRKWWAVTTSWLDKCREHVEASLTELSLGKDIASFEMEYYDALDYLLNPIRRVDSAERGTFVAKLRKEARNPEAKPGVEVAKGIQALSAVLNGGDMLFPGYDYGYLEADNVKVAVQWLDTLFVPEWDALTSGVTNRMLDEADLYPGGWEEWGDDGRSHLQQRFRALSEFFSEAADRGTAMVVGPSGADLEHFVYPVLFAG